MLKCSVVILNWNGEQTLRQFLPSVLEHTQLPDVEIVVADNGSTDASLDYLRTQPVRIIELDKNYGFAEGYNRAIAQVDSEYVMLLNSDVEVTPRWLETMLQYMNAHPSTLAMQPKVLSWHSKQQFDRGEVSAIRFEHAGAAGGMMDMLGYPFCRGRLMSHVEEDHGQYDTIAPIFWATGACLLVRTRVYKDLGGLDANFFAHQEEIDFCWRIWTRTPSTSPLKGENSLPSKGGLERVVCLPFSTVYHVGGATLGYENPRKTFLNFRNNLLMLRKNLPASRLWWVMVIRFFMDYLAALQMLLTGQLPNAKAVFRARREYHQMKRQYPIGTLCRPLHKRNALTLLAHRSIVLDSYLLRKKQ